MLDFLGNFFAFLGGILNLFWVSFFEASGALFATVAEAPSRHFLNFCSCCFWSVSR